MINLDIVRIRILSQLGKRQGSQIILSPGSYCNPVSTPFGRDAKAHFAGLLRRRHICAQRRVLQQPCADLHPLPSSRHRLRNEASTPDNRNMSYNTGSLSQRPSLIRFCSLLQPERIHTAMLALPGSREDDIEFFIALSARTGVDRKAPDGGRRSAEKWYAYFRHGDDGRKKRIRMSNTGQGVERSRETLIGRIWLNQRRIAQLGGPDFAACKIR